MRILCLGDSNTYGYDPRGFWGGRYGPEVRWPDLLAAKTGWNVVNEGVSGQCVPCALPADLSDAACILVMLGTNDLLQGDTPGEIAERMKAFLKQLLPLCPHPVLIAPPPMKRGAWVPSQELIDRSGLLAREYQRIARELSIPFADTRGWQIGMTFDGVHFSEEGHRRFAAQLLEVLSSRFPAPGE